MSGAKRDPAGLPAAYAAFAPVFERLSEPLQLILQGHLAQFEPLAASLHPPEVTHHGEFEGLGGLTQRGEISQIVHSELVLRTEAPLEFLRRLAESETLYHQKQYADPGARAVYRAMISVGPVTLGHGRILSLAALFFLARVAQQRDARFYWCFLPRADGAVWFDELSINTLKRFLKAASFREMGVAEAEDAWQLWTDLSGARQGQAAEPVDWVIGARRPPSLRTFAVNAVDHLPNALAFAIAPPAPGVPRTASLLLRKGGGTGRTVEIQFPADGVCVSALNTPLRPLAPGQSPQPTAKARPARPGWAASYFVLSSGDSIIVRLASGLLLLRFDQDGRVAGRWHMPLKATDRVAGVLFQQEGFSVVLQTRVAGADTIAYGFFRLAPGDAPHRLLHKAQAFPSEHLFRKQGRYDVPSFSAVDGARFYSTSGMPFQFEFGGRGHEQQSVRPRYNTPKILYSSGVYDVLRPDETGAALLRVFKRGGAHADTFACPDAIGADPVLGMTYSGGERSLAYSVAPLVWTIAPLSKGAAAEWHAEALRLPVERFETLVSGRVTEEGLIARVWSDARFGGDGTVRVVNRINDKTTRGKQRPLWLGDHAMDIVKVELGADGSYWALSVGATGEPAALLQFRSVKKGAKAADMRLDLAEELQGAVTIEMDGADG